ncbi:MAG: glycine-rich domain-containing protein, partial [Candidatus Competibacterales bacterium]
AFDDSQAVLPFSQRLARDNHWSSELAQRAIEEYRRFVFLAMVASHSVTPSDQVDQVWHLHLLYTQNYWEDFCRLLPRPLHHGPTRGGSFEDSKYEDWYSCTRASYYHFFGEHPPADLWPAAVVRFGRDTRWIRINRKDYWLIPKPRWL